MTDRESAAGLVEALEYYAKREEHAISPITAIIREAITMITALLSELERVGRELADAIRWMEEAGKAAEARALKAEALVAEAVRVCEPFAKRAGKLDGHWLDHETHWSPAYGSTEITIRDLRAASAFIEKAKS